MKNRILALCMLWLTLGAAPAMALQNELAIYAGVPQPVPARIMLLIDTSGSMDWGLGGCLIPGVLDCRSKWSVLRETLDKFIDAGGAAANATVRWPDDFEIGLARFGINGAVILAPVERLDANVTLNGETKTQRQWLADRLAGIDPDGSTPLLGSYLEVLEYLEGRKTLSRSSYDNSVSSVWTDATKLTYQRGMDDALICGVNNNHLVVLTDGLSTEESTAREVEGSAGVTYGHRIQQFVNDNNDNQYLATCDETVSTGRIEDPNNPTWPCVDALAEKLADRNPADLAQIRGVHTHTIAYSLGSGVCGSEPFASPSTAPQYLCNWALKGAGSSFAATDESGLINAFKSISTTVAMTDSFTAAVPGVGVNQANRFTFLDEVYYSVFQPSGSRFWYGNLKKYQLGLHNNQPTILGQNNQPVDGNGDGFFDGNAQSFWFSAADYLPSVLAADGDKVMLGGAALKIPAKAQRHLFTRLGGSDLEVTDGNVSTLTTAMLPGTFADATEESDMRAKADAVANWLRGDDALNLNEWERLTGVDPKLVRTLYGAPIHSSPVLVNYTSTTDAGAGQWAAIPDAANQDNLVFVSTNDGKLYAVDAKTGAEKLAFVPGELLTRAADGSASRIEQLYDAARNNQQGPLLYGLDATWTAWRQDMDKNGNITTSNSSQDFVYLYGGMRRGGRNYYGLDVTHANDSTPSLSQMFALTGGSANTPLANLGQTWSEPVLGVMRYSATQSLVVLVFAGGYDPLYDSGRPAANQIPMGAQLYMVAAHDRPDLNINAGDVLWWASADASGAGSPHLQVSEMTDSIPSTVKLLDRDGDGRFDHVYVGDLGGQVFRFDVAATLTDSTPLTAIRIASLGYRENGTAANDRRFWFPPSIALMKDGSGRKHVALALGSGLLTSPRDTQVDERFYFLKDYAPFGISVAAADNPPYAFDLTLESEKMLGSPVIVGGQAFFSTYYWGDNQQQGADQCRAQYGRAALYQYDPKDNAAPDRILRAQPLSLAGSIATVLKEIPARPAADGNPATAAGTDFVGLGGTSVFDLPDVDLGNIRKTRWKQCPESGACD